MAKGKLQRWNDDKGFGFIMADNGSDNIFIHISELKNAGRRPVVGDVLLYTLITSDGKSKAINARIEGVSPVNKGRKISSSASSDFFSKIVFLILALGIAFFAYNKFLSSRVLPVSSIKNVASEEKAYELEPTIMPVPIAKIEHHCDGRQYCSQMTSMEEAEYFVKHCPDTKMDGDHDGYPCEGDSRF